MPTNSFVFFRRTPNRCPLRANSAISDSIRGWTCGSLLAKFRWNSNAFSAAVDGTWAKTKELGIAAMEQSCAIRAVLAIRSLRLLRVCELPTRQYQVSSQDEEDLYHEATD